ncbi:MAG: universal stress protein [Deltaproteobacteria bacterium]|nr:universal stress protein [Deltaproteobacteria bacterium]
MIKKILVALDASSHAKAVTAYALWLGRGFRAELTGLHVVDVVAMEGPFLHDLSGSLGFEPFLNFSTKMREALEATGRDILETFKEDCEKAGVESSVVMASGIVSNEICSRARTFDLVIIGRRGINVRFEHGLFGSATEGVIRKSPGPVFVSPGEFKPPVKPLLAYDGSPNAAKAMRAAAEFSKTFAFPLTVLAAAKAADDEGVLKEARDYLRLCGVNADFVRVPGQPSEGIADYYGKNGHDILFMGATHHSRIAQMVLGSTTEGVMRSVEGPFFLER